MAIAEEWLLPKEDTSKPAPSVKRMVAVCSDGLGCWTGRGHMSSGYLDHSKAASVKHIYE